MNKKVATIAASVILTSSCIIGFNKIQTIYAQNFELRKQLEISKSTNKSNIEQVKEINKENTKLIIYESNKGQYIKEIQEDKLIAVKSKIETKYSYNVVCDLSKAKVYDINNTTYIEIDYSSVKINNIEIDKPAITNDLNILSQLKGKTISDLNNELTSQSYEEIENYVNYDFENNSDRLKKNLRNKVDKLYDGLNVNIEFAGDIK